MNTNNPYLVERLIELKMEDTQKEMQQIHLRKKARLAGTNWLTHLVNTLLDLRRTRRIGLQDHPYTELRSHPLSQEDRLTVKEKEKILWQLNHKFPRK